MKIPAILALLGHPDGRLTVNRLTADVRTALATKKPPDAVTSADSAD